MIHEVRYVADTADYHNAVIDVWYVDEGDEVEESDEIVDIETEDESVVTVQSPTTGTVKEIFVEEGEMVEPGDLLAIMTAGAYGAVQAGTYNTRALVPEVLVREGEWALVRPRLEVSELIALDRLPPWL